MEMFTLEFKNVNLTIVDMNCYPCQKPLQRHLLTILGFLLVFVLCANKSCDPCC